METIITEHNQSLETNLNDVKTFLDHIQGRVGEGAFDVIYAIVEEAIKQNEELVKLLSSDSVYTLLRFGAKNPSSSGVDDCEEERFYYDLYNISTKLRSDSRAKLQPK